MSHFADAAGFVAALPAAVPVERPSSPLVRFSSRYASLLRKWTQ